METQKMTPVGDDGGTTQPARVIEPSRRLLIAVCSGLAVAVLASLILVILLLTRSRPDDPEDSHQAKAMAQVGTKFPAKQVADPAPEETPMTAPATRPDRKPPKVIPEPPKLKPTPPAPAPAPQKPQPPVAKKQKEPQKKILVLGFTFGDDAQKIRKGDTLITMGEFGGLRVKLIETKSLIESFRRKLRLAVTRPHYDDMGKLLAGLGDGYQFTTIADDELLSAEHLKRFDIVFLTCGIGNYKPEMHKALREFVEAGGTLYASDLRFDAIAKAFPEYLRPEGEYPHGHRNQDVEAKVVDPALRRIFGTSLKLHFNAGGWRPASFDRNKVEVLLEGTYRVSGRLVKETAPLLVRFRHGKGTVIFTSFHNEVQQSKTEENLLRYLVFSAVTSPIEASLAKSVMSGSFQPIESKRLGLSEEGESIAGSYDHKKAGPLRFALGFPHVGARLRLSLVAPTGQKVYRESDGTFTLEVANAPAGTWQYEVTAVRLPYRNFPFTLTIGMEK